METYKKVLLAVVTLAALWLVYEVAVAIPRAEIEAQERQAELDRQAEVMRDIQTERNYRKCLADAYANYSADWDSTCVIDGKEPDCTLPAYRHTPINESHEDDRATCLEIYKANK